MKRIGSIALAAAGLGVIGGCSGGGLNYSSINEVAALDEGAAVRFQQVSDIDHLMTTPRVEGWMVTGVSKFTTNDPTAATHSYADTTIGPVAADKGASFVRWAMNEIEPPQYMAEGNVIPGKYEFGVIYYCPLEQPVPQALAFRNQTSAPYSANRVAFSTRWMNESGKISNEFAVVDDTEN